MKKTFLSMIAGALVLGALIGPVAAKSAKPQATTFYLHGTQPAGEAQMDETALNSNWMILDTTEPAAGAPKSIFVTNYFRGPNTDCNGNGLLPVWRGNMTGKVKGDVTLTLHTVGTPTVQLVASLYADGTGQCASDGSNPALPAADGFYRCVVSNPGGIATTGPAALVVTRTFAQWLAATDLTGSAAAAGADPDLDGISNIAEFYHGLDPQTPASANDRAALPVISTTTISGTTSLSFVYRKNTRALLAPPVFETTTTLTGPWSPVTPTSVDALAPDPVTGDPRERATFQSPAAVSKVFYRMRFNP